MMLCLAESLIKSDGNELNDQMRRYIAWYKEGIHYSQWEFAAWISCRKVIKK